jgi:putative redox protein
MNIICTWNEQLKFTATTAQHRVEMDAKPPFGTDQAMSPKQLLLAGIGGCTAMDVISLLRKHKQQPQTLEVEADAPIKAGSKPAIFEYVHLFFRVTGAIEKATLIEAVTLSQSLYCGVSAMVAGVVPIRFTIELNHEIVHEGEAHF